MPSTKLIQIGIIIAAVVAILATVYMRGRHDVQALWDSERASYAVVLAKTVADNKAREAQLRAAVDTARTDMMRGIQDVESNLNSTIASLRAGNRKLRPQYTCANPVSGATTDSPGITGSDVADSAGKLLERCAGASAAGDRAIIQRNACVEILKGERQQ